MATITRRLEQAMKLSVNGTATEVTADPDAPVVDVLRDRLGLTGTKAACGTGACGACTILVDGAPAVGCLTACSVLQDREITTVEGLGGDHPVQRAFAAHDALQCGYCTPGFVVEAAAFVDRWRAEHPGAQVPDRAAIAQAMAGHLCRCGAYQAIFAAIAAACAGKHDAPLLAAPARVEALEKITGPARYTADIRLDGQLEGVIIRSVHAHAWSRRSRQRICRWWSCCRPIAGSAMSVSRSPPWWLRPGPRRKRRRRRCGSTTRCWRRWSPPRRRCGPERPWCIPPRRSGGPRRAPTKDRPPPPSGTATCAGRPA